MPGVVVIEKRGRGHPTEFTPELGEQILALMEEGLSLATTAAELNIHRRGVCEWEMQHPEFADIKKLARGKRQLFLERRLLAAQDGPTVTSCIFALKNAAPVDWREKFQTENSTNVNVTTTRELDISKLSVEQLDALEAALEETVRQLGPPTIEA